MKQQDFSLTLRAISDCLPSAIGSLNAIPRPFRSIFESRLCLTYLQEADRPSAYSKRVSNHSAAVTASSEVTDWYYVPWDLLMAEPHASRLLSACESHGMRGAMDYAWKDGNIKSVFFSSGGVDPANSLMVERYLRSVADSALKERVGLVVLDRDSVSMRDAEHFTKQVNIPGSRVLVGNKETLMDHGWFTSLNAYETTARFESSLEYRKIERAQKIKASVLPSGSITDRMNKISKRF